MDCRPSYLKLWLSTAIATMATLMPALAQQSIIFSKPAEVSADKANSFMPEPSHTGPSAFNAPSPLFGRRPTASFDILPGAQRPAPISPEQALQWQKFLDKKKNWTLMTPEEILGVPTPEKILGILDPD